MNSVSVTETIQKLFNVLTWMGVSRTHIDRNINGKYILSPTRGIKRLLYVLFRINFIIKTTFLILLYFGAFGVQFEFMDLMAILLWFLIIALILISERLFRKSSPFFEILSSGWKLQNSIYQKLGRPQHLKKTLEHSVKKKVAFQCTIILVGNLAMIVQYSSAPKYCVFTGSLVEADTSLINLLFGLHEIGFLFLAWSLYGSTICVSSILGGQLIHTIDAMTEELEELGEILKIHSAHEERGESATSEMPRKSSYTFESLVADYRSLMLYVDRLNSFAAYNFLCVHITAYMQMIADVYVMIQILRSGEADFMGVFFFAEDCMVCMYMLFKCFKAMSFVSESGNAFVHGLKSYLYVDRRNQKLYAQILQTTRPIAMKIGPGFVDPSTVGNAMMVLLNYYIMVALW